MLPLPARKEQGWPVEPASALAIALLPLVWLTQRKTVSGPRFAACQAPPIPHLVLQVKNGVPLSVVGNGTDKTAGGRQPAIKAQVGFWGTAPPLGANARALCAVRAVRRAALLGQPRHAAPAVVLSIMSSIARRSQQRKRDNIADVAR